MEIRINMVKVEPNAYKVMDALDKFVIGSEIPPLHRELIKIRASQINGCAYCVNYHTHDALKLGETQQRLNLIAVWREAGNIFTDEELLLFQMTEQVTLIHRRGLSKKVYDNAIATFGELKTAQIIMAIVTINAWNRIGVSLNMHPQLDQQPLTGE